MSRRPSCGGGSFRGNSSMICGALLARKVRRTAKPCKPLVRGGEAGVGGKGYTAVVHRLEVVAQHAFGGKARDQVTHREFDPLQPANRNTIAVAIVEERN